MTNDNLKQYPICDTDIWIKVTRDTDIFSAFINLYQKIIFTDAVKFELNNKSEDSPKDFKYSLMKCREILKQELGIYLSLRNKIYFDENKLKIILRLFNEHSIYYNLENECIFKRQKNLGETVCLIYAYVLNIPVILSDDNDSIILAEEKFYGIEIYNLKYILEKLEVEKEIIEKYKTDLNLSQTDKENLEEFKISGQIKDIKNIKNILTQNKKM